MTDLKDLKELANAATGDAWKTFDGRRVETEKRHEVSGVPIDICEAEEGVDAFFIAAANPKTVLELIARVEAAEGARDQWRDMAADQDMNAGAIHSIREACAQIMGGNCTFVDDDFVNCLLKLRDENASLRTALSQAKAREGELRSALEPCDDFPCAMDCVGGCEKLAGRARPFTSLPQAAVDVLNERKRQFEKEGWSEWHDDQHHDDFELSRAAACYALNLSHAAEIQERKEPIPGLDQNPARMNVKAPRFWPWLSKWWKPKSPRRDLVRAAALIIAEIERLDRNAVTAMGGDDNG